jgi:hypothetical protein
MAEDPNTVHLVEAEYHYEVKFYCEDEFRPWYFGHTVHRKFNTGVAERNNGLDSVPFRTGSFVTDATCSTCVDNYRAKGHTGYEPAVYLDCTEFTPDESCILYTYAKHRNLPDTVCSWLSPLGVQVRDALKGKNKYPTPEVLDLVDRFKALVKAHETPGQSPEATDP